MKQLYTVPFERNSEHVKQLRNQYVQRVMEIEGRQTHHIFIFVDEAGFNLAKARRRGRNVIGKSATVNVPGQRGANITMCAATSTDGPLLHRPLIGPYNTERLLAFLHDLYGRVVLGEERDAERRNQPTFITVWDNVAFHHSRAVTEWFAAHPRMESLFLPPYSPFLNPIEEFFSSVEGGRFTTIIHMIKCPSWMQRMLDACRYQQQIARDGSGMPEDYFLGVLP
ncbi:uncharacterized protein LOC120735527 [Simochromis diagramma]|uniref:uncharacterized protein LOC120735527 n=1 Tax=Simochromis diagramma TaxID=43689 RepID=UPI001A7E7CFC|nr:uncharacterized protein LOC120735527 [Simochromis diagramma]